MTREASLEIQARLCEGPLGMGPPSSEQQEQRRQKPSHFIRSFVSFAADLPCTSQGTGTESVTAPQKAAPPAQASQRRPCQHIQGFSGQTGGGCSCSYECARGGGELEDRKHAHHYCFGGLRVLQFTAHMSDLSTNSQHSDVTCPCEPNQGPTELRGLSRLSELCKRCGVVDTTHTTTQLHV